MYVEQELIILYIRHSCLIFLSGVSFYLIIKWNVPDWNKNITYDKDLPFIIIFIHNSAENLEFFSLICMIYIRMLIQTKQDVNSQRHPKSVISTVTYKHTNPITKIF